VQYAYSAAGATRRCGMPLSVCLCVCGGAQGLPQSRLTPPVPLHCPGGRGGAQGSFSYIDSYSYIDSHSSRTCGMLRPLSWPILQYNLANCAVLLCHSNTLVHGVIAQEGVAALKASFAAYDANLASTKGLRACAARKFELPAAMACGTIADFHLGLQGRIGHLPPPLFLPTHHPLQPPNFTIPKHTRIRICPPPLRPPLFLSSISRSRTLTRARADPGNRAFYGAIQGHLSWPWKANFMAPYTASARHLVVRHKRPYVSPSP
jgi:hypothetical protein